MQVVETSVTNNSLSKGYPHPEDHDKPITDTPGFKPLTKNPSPTYSTVHVISKKKNSLIYSDYKKLRIWFTQPFNFLGSIVIMFIDNACTLSLTEI